MEKKLKIIFLGTPEFASIILEKLLKWSDGEVVCVVTQPDRPKGRGKRLSFSAVKKLALKHQITVVQPENINKKEVTEYLTTFSADIIVVAAYGQILSSSVLTLTPLGAVNVHASLLPKYRGASPIHWAILNGEKVTGVTIMKMDKGLDTGPVLAQKVVPIDIYDTAQTLHDKLAEVGSNLLLKTLKSLKNSTVIPVPQDDTFATYAPLLKKSDGLINWDNPARKVHDHIRAMYPWPGAFFSWKKDESTKEITLKIFPGSILFEDSTSIPSGTILKHKNMIKIACRDFFYLPSRIQPQSSKPLTPEAFSCGYLK